MINNREYLYKWFYPPDYQPQEITNLPEPGTTRKFRNFDFKMSMQKDCTFDILFTKNKVCFCCVFKKNFDQGGGGAVMAWILE